MDINPQTLHPEDRDRVGGKMKILIAACAAMLVLAVAVPVITDEARNSSAKTSEPGENASDQGRESSARGREHRDAMKAWRECVAEQDTGTCTKPPPPGKAHGHDKASHDSKAAKKDKAHQQGRDDAPGQQKPKPPKADD